MKYLLFAVLLIVCLLFLFREYTRPVPSEMIIKQTDTLFIYHDSVFYIEVPVSTFTERIVYRDVPADVDTSAILELYYSLLVVDRVFKDDSLAFIRLVDSISENRVMGSGLTYLDRTPTAIVCHSIFEPYSNKGQLFVGSLLYYSGSFSFFCPTLSYGSSGNNIYSLGYDPFNRGFLLSVSIKLPLL